MKKFLLVLLAVSFCGFGAVAQMGGRPPGGNLDSGVIKLFGDNQMFSAVMLTEISGERGAMTAKSKIYFDHENTRFEMDMSDVQGPNLPPGAFSRLQSMGMDKVVTITPADKKTMIVIYPNIQSYVAAPYPGAAATDEDFKVDTSKLGEETVEGHPCIKNKTVVTGGGQTHEFTVWNASDLKNFPIKIAMSANGTPMTMTYEDISFEKPAGSLFQPPQNLTRYDSMQELMQHVMMSNGGGAPAAPAH